ncbi:MAG: macrolide ABC transporter permease, partial [Pseudomonadota bacterium]
MKALIDDIRFSLGALASQPLFTFTVILTLALAVGANTAVFSVVHGVLLSELPYEDAEDVVRIRLESTARPGQRSELSPAEVADLIERSQFIETAGFFNWAG